MRRKLVLEMEECYPFGGAAEEYPANTIYVVKRVPFSTAAQKCNLLKKIQLLRNLSCYTNIVALLDTQTGPQHLSLIYEYIPYGFDELLRRNCDRQLAEARRTLAEVTLQLKQLGVVSRINEKNVGLNEARQLKCYVAIEDIPDFSLLQGQEECHSIREQLNESDQLSREENNLSMEKQVSNGNLKTQVMAGNARLDDLEKEVVKRSGVSNYHSEQLETTDRRLLVDHLLQKINGRLIELSNRRRQSSSSRLNYNDRKLSATDVVDSQDGSKQANHESTVASRHQRKGSSKASMIRSQLQEVNRAASTDLWASEVRGKQYSPLEQYESLKTQRKMMLERIKAVMERADSAMAGFRTSRKRSTHME